MQPSPPPTSVETHAADAVTGDVNEAQLEVLLVEIRGMARQFGRRLVRPHDLDDLSQDVVLMCLASIREGAWNGHIAPLPVIVAHLVRCRAADRRVRLERASAREAEFGRDVLGQNRSWMAPDASMEERDLEELRAKALDKLSPACRLAYELVREEGLSYKEAATMLGVSRRNISRLVVRAHQKLRGQLKRRGIVAPARGGGALQNALGVEGCGGDAAALGTGRL